MTAGSSVHDACGEAAASAGTERHCGDPVTERSIAVTGGPAACRWMLERLLSLLVPPACLACRAPLARPGETLCARCRSELPWLPARTCARCALPRPCRPCPAWRSGFASAWAPMAHDGVARALVRELKFRGTPAAADLMAAQIAANAPPGIAHGRLLVPVPIHPARLRSRGYDQARSLARGLARRWGCTLAPVLVRVDRAGARQVGASRAGRRAAGRVEVRARARVPGAITLVDDVHTTGATLDACAQALRAAGACEIHAVTYTRTLP